MDQERVAHTGSPAQFQSTIGAQVEVVVADPDVMVKATAVLDQLTGVEPSFAPGNPGPSQEEERAA